MAPLTESGRIDIVCEYAKGVLAAIIDKRKRLLTLKPHEVYNSIFSETLIMNVLNVMSLPRPPIIMFDKGRLTPARLHGFKQHVLEKDHYAQQMGYRKYRGTLAAPMDVPSVLEPGLWAADIVAGAFYHKYMHNDWSYSNALRPIAIGNGERLYSS